jgi:hypothetical protein
MRRSIPGLAPIFGIMFTKSPKKKKRNLNLEVAKLDTVNNSQSALFSRDDVKKAGRQCETGGIAGLAKRGGPRPTGPRMSADRNGGLEEKKKKGRYGQCFGDSPCASHAHTNNLERPCFLPVVEGMKGTWEMHGGFSATSRQFGTDAFILQERTVMETLGRLSNGSCTMVFATMR